jgi:hypothetical protein
VKQHVAASHICRLTLPPVGQRGDSLYILGHTIVRWMRHVSAKHNSLGVDICLLHLCMCTVCMFRKMVLARGSKGPQDGS